MNAPPLPRWNLSSFYASPSDPAIEADIAASRAQADDFNARFAGTVATLDGDSLHRAMREYETLLQHCYGPSMYASLASSVDTLDDATRAVHARAHERLTDTLNRLRFFDVELATAPDSAYERWRTHGPLAQYRHHLERARRFAPHTLSRDVENTVAIKNLTGRRAWIQLYDELTAGYAFDFEYDGERRERTLAEMRALRMSTDRSVRARAHAAVLTRFERDAPIIAYIHNTLCEDHRLENDLRHHTKAEAPTLLDDEIPEATLDALMTAVEAHYPVAQTYFRLKARHLKLDALATHDLLAPYTSQTRNFSWDDARSEVLRAFAAIDGSLVSRAEAFFEEGRIDAEPRLGKRDGAFCAAMVPGVAPHVLVNYTGDLHDVVTLAHELGHGVHFAFAGERQSLLNYWPTTPMAETASMFGEMLLVKNFRESERDPEIRRQMLASCIEAALGTIHRQVCFTRFERNLHMRRAQGVVPLAEFSALWEGELARFYGHAVQRAPHDAWGWATIAHLVHYRFYCYSYAFGQSLVFALYRRWEQEGAAFVPRYLELLASGGSDAPAALLARVGIDINDPEFWHRGLDVVTAMVEEFAALS